MGTRTARLAACLRPSVPISGQTIRRATAATGPMPGLERRIESGRARRAQADLDLGLGGGDLGLGLQRIHLAQRQVAGAGAFEGRMVGAGRLMDDPCGRCRAQPSPQRPEPMCVVGETPAFPVAQEHGVEPVFGDVDRDAIVIHLHCPLLVMQGSRRCVPVQAQGEDGGRSHIETVILRPSHTDPTTAGGDQLQLVAPNPFLADDLRNA